MDNWLMIKTHGDPLGTLRKLIRTVWAQLNLDGMLVPIDTSVDISIKPRIIKKPSQLEEVNPFKPLMSINAAKLIPELINSYPDSYLGALLRPCEMRALVEMIKRNKFSMDKLLTISIDCLGTFPADEFIWRAGRKGATEDLTKETLQFARQGGIMAYRYRSACQLCVSPNAHGADLNIGILGLPIRQYLLIATKDSAVDNRLSLESIADGPAESSLITQREKLLAKLEERRTRTRNRVTQGIADILPANIETLIDHLGECGDCQKCLDTCPICSIDFPQRGEDNRYQTSDIMRWMVSCAGCGMCEQACPQHQPLSIIFGHIQRQLSEEYEYIPGTSPDQPLPLML